eukprot:3094009-Rhodomonas_salina.1
MRGTFQASPTVWSWAGVRVHHDGRAIALLRLLSESRRPARRRHGHGDSGPGLWQTRTSVTWQDSDASESESWHTMITAAADAVHVPASAVLPIP